MNDVKEILYAYFLDNINERISSLQKALKDVQAAANNETKSSVGDKYETGRAMAQLEIEKLTKQLTETVQSKQILQQVDGKRQLDTVHLGSIVYTTAGNFFICINGGTYTANTEKFTAISLASPIGLLLKGKRAGERVMFRTQEILVKQVI